MMNSVIILLTCLIVSVVEITCTNHVRYIHLSLGDFFAVKNIVLTGFMGTGKSSVGKELSTIRNIPFIDTDEEITKKFGPISELFENHGEEFFRKCEREIILQVAKTSEVVIATGGGVVMDPENIKVLEASGEIICLTANPEDVVNRLTGAGEVGVRPLLDVDDPINAISTLLAIREDVYKQFAQFDTVGKSPSEIAHEIDDFLNAKN